MPCISISKRAKRLKTKNKIRRLKEIIQKLDKNLQRRK